MKTAITVEALTSIKGKFDKGDHLHAKKIEPTEIKHDKVLILIRKYDGQEIMLIRAVEDKGSSICLRGDDFNLTIDKTDFEAAFSEVYEVCQRLTNV